MPATLGFCDRVRDTQPIRSRVRAISRVKLIPHRILSSFGSTQEDDAEEIKHIFKGKKLFDWIIVDHYELSSLNDDYFNLNSNILWNVSLCENELRHNSDTTNNQRANHLSYCNHKILSNIILNFFNNTNYSEQFYKDIFKKENSGEEFIYE